MCHVTVAVEVTALVTDETPVPTANCTGSPDAMASAAAACAFAVTARARARPTARARAGTAFALAAGPAHFGPGQTKVRSGRYGLSCEKCLDEARAEWDAEHT